MITACKPQIAEVRQQIAQTNAETESARSARNPLWHLSLLTGDPTWASPDRFPARMLALQPFTCLYAHARDLKRLPFLYRETENKTSLIRCPRFGIHLVQHVHREYRTLGDLR
jgi:hypothetical protein